MSEAQSDNRSFQSWSTALYAMAWALLMLHGWGARLGGDPSSWLYDPATSAGRMVARDLERAIPNDDAPAANRVEVFLHGHADEVLASSIAIHRELIESLGDGIDLGLDGFDSEIHLSQPLVEVAVADESIYRGEVSEERAAQARARLAVMLAESGELESALEVARQIPDSNVSTVLELIYGNTARGTTRLPSDADLIGILANQGLEDWYLERPAIRLLESRQEADAAASITGALRERGVRRQATSNWLTGASLLLVVIGVASCIVLAVGGVGRNRETSPPLSVPPWSLALGFGVLIRADFWNRLYFVVLGEFGAQFPNAQWLTPFYTWGTVIASLPLIWLIYRHLAPVAQGNLANCFGVGSSRLGFGQLIAITLAALAIDLLGAYLLAWGAGALGFDGHWAEGLDETLIWGTSREVIQVTIDYLVWTPLFEELTFRGMLYYTLRRKLDPLSAALLSAGIFGSLHFYSLPGFLATFWSGFVWALAFERARSLVPGVAAHGIYNLLYVAGMVALYR